jgi:hypothetical protein
MLVAADGGALGEARLLLVLSAADGDSKILEAL